VYVRWIEFFLVGKKKGLVGASFGILIFVCLLACLFLLYVQGGLNFSK
jgi:hypothetical protein